MRFLLIFILDLILFVSAFIGIDYIFWKPYKVKDYKCVQYSERSGECLKTELNINDQKFIYINKPIN